MSETRPCSRNLGRRSSAECLFSSSFSSSSSNTTGESRTKDENENEDEEDRHV